MKALTCYTLCRFASLSSSRFSHSFFISTSIHPCPVSSSLSQHPSSRILQSLSNLSISSHCHHFNRFQSRQNPHPKSLFYPIQQQSVCSNLSLWFCLHLSSSHLHPYRHVSLSPRYPQSCHLPSYPQSTILVLNPSPSFYLHLSPLSSNYAPQM